MTVEASNRNQRALKWYEKYDALRAQVSSLQDAFEKRCFELHAERSTVLDEFMREIIIRAVHESNWQEGIELEKGRTQELANAAFEQLDTIVGPHLHMPAVLGAGNDVKKSARGLAQSKTLREYRDQFVGLLTSAATEADYVDQTKCAALGCSRV